MCVFTGLMLGAVACSSDSSGPVPAPISAGPPRPNLTATASSFGLPKDAFSGRPWLSGVWVGGTPTTDALVNFGTWRGAPVEVVTTYSPTSSFEEMKATDWSITTFAGFAGTLSYGLALVPEKGGHTLGSVASGEHDDVWRAIGQHLVDNGRDRSIVRIGLEPNGDWFPWGATAETAGDFQQAFRRVATILRQVAPRVVIDFDIACGVGLRGTQDPQAPLTMLYPGDDVVDVIGCDTYDDGGMKVDRGAAFLGKNDKGPGLSDVLAFARARKKPMSIPEWGLDARHAQGDNGPYIFAMRDFLEANAKYILFESYFNEPGTAIRSSIWQDVQNPVSSQAYRLRWHNPSRATIATSAGT